MSSSYFNRRDFLKAASMTVVSLAVPGCKRISHRLDKLNFVFVLVDDMGWTDAGCYGSRFYETPNIDRLAAEGMRFTDAYASCAVCSPTRASIMTGRYPARIGITDWIRAGFQGGKVPPDRKNPSGYGGGKNRKLLCPRNHKWLELDDITIPEALKNAGYASCFIGKWHLGFEDWYPDKQGFDFNIGGCDYGQPPSYFDPYYRKGHGGIPTLSPRQKGEYLTDREGDEAARFIRNHRNKPFFLYLSNYAVHTPLQGKKELIEKYKAKKPTNQKNPVYAAMIESVDQAVGRVISELNALNLIDNTVIIFTSDNGGYLEATDNAPIRSGKGYPYEGGIRVPLIICWPGVVKAGSVCHVPVTSVDFFPTICEAVCVPLPADRVNDGLSLVPLLKQAGHLNRDAIFWHFPHYRGRIVPYSIIRCGDWKLIKRYEGKTFELFNLKNDLSEKNDRSAEQSEKVKELDSKLTVWLKATNAKLPKTNPEYDPAWSPPKKRKKK
jgi:arylsulfatase A-like enzyme